MRRRAWDVAEEIMRSNPTVMVCPDSGSGYLVSPRSSLLVDVPHQVFASASRMRRALPDLVQAWNLELVKRSQLSLTF